MPQRTLHFNPDLTYVILDAGDAQSEMHLLTFGDKLQINLRFLRITWNPINAWDCEKDYMRLYGNHSNQITNIEHIEMLPIQ